MTWESEPPGVARKTRVARPLSAFAAAAKSSSARADRSTGVIASRMLGVYPSMVRENHPDGRRVR